MTTTYKRSAGFTLIEILIVFAILIALFALLVPVVFRGYRQYLSREAETHIKMIQGQLEVYLVDNRKYPTTEEGLYALMYIPDSVGVVPPMPQPNMPGVPGAGDPNTMTDPSITGGMMNQSKSIGAESLTNPSTVQPGGVSGGVGINPGTGQQSMLPGGGVGGGIDPTTGLPSTDPMGGTGGTMTSAWTQPFSNPQLYRQQRTRSNPYIDSKDLLDPWGQPYRYDASFTYYGANQYTGEPRPAIWSAGPDKQDGTDDDVRNWKPEEVQGLLLKRQQQMQMQQGGQYGTGTQSIGAENLNNPMMPTQPGGMMPTQPGGMMPTQPGGMPPTQPTGR